MTSRDRRRIPIPFGAGLDREAGLMVAPPMSMEDLRNLFLHAGKYIVRRGFERRFQLIDDEGTAMTDVLCGHALRSQRTAIYAGYDSVSGDVKIFRGDGFGESATWIGDWFSLPAGSNPPIVLMAESYNRVFIAHDHVSEANRAATIYYDGDDDSIHTLQGDFGGGLEDVKFRGVERHLDYLWGWGFAGNSQVRPEIVRVSLPGDPLTFNPEHYFQVGDRNDAVIRCIPAGGTLLTYKETETWEIFGYSRDSFGTRPLDPRYGMGVSRLCVNVSGVVFAWTNEGPRLYDGSWSSDSLELPLELTAPEPGDLIEALEIKWAFAAYLPTYRVVLFFFGPRVYALSVRVPQDWKWSYWEIGFTPLCGFELPSGPGGLVTPPTAYADNLSSPAQTTTTADVQFDVHDQDGDEYAEIWIKGTGTWMRWLTIPVTLDTTHSTQLTGLSPGVDYEWAVRIRRGPYYTEGYDSESPDDWPSDSKSTFSTGLGFPTIEDAVWSRTSATSEQIQLTITPNHYGVDVEILRDGEVVHTETAPGAIFNWTDTGFSPEADNSYTVRHVTEDQEGTESGATVVWGGPSPAPSGVTISDGVFGDDYQLDWFNGRPDLETEVWDNWEDGVGEGAFPATLRNTKVAGLDSTDEVLSNPAPDGDTVEASVRHVQVLFGVYDYSDFAPSDSKVIA